MPPSRSGDHRSASLSARYRGDGLSPAAPARRAVPTDVWLSQCRRNTLERRPPQVSVRFAETGIASRARRYGRSRPERRAFPILGWDKDTIAVTARSKCRDTRTPRRPTWPGRFGSTHRGPPFAHGPSRRAPAVLVGEFRRVRAAAPDLTLPPRTGRCRSKTGDRHEDCPRRTGRSRSPRWAVR